MIEPRRRQRQGVLSLLAACLVFAAACKKSPSSTSVPAPIPAQSPTTSPIASTSTPQQRYEERVRGLQASTLSAESKQANMGPLEALRYGEEQEILDRKELVTPAPRDFKPESAKQKIRLTLTLEKAILHRGEKPRFRLEMTNIGQEPIYYLEDQGSFYKTCVLSTPVDYLDFIVTMPEGRQQKLLSPWAPGDQMVLDEIKFPAGWTDAQKAEWVRQKNLRNHAEGGLSIHLQPGETLRTRGDAPGDMFCALRTDTNLKTAGTYKIQVKFDDTPPPFDERDVPRLEKLGFSRESDIREHEKMLAEAMGRIESNSVNFEVAP